MFTETGVGDATRRCGDDDGGDDDNDDDAE
jgi:hypothetical protein